MSGTALVTGAGGFVGTHLVRYLKSRNWEVIGCDLVQGEGIYKCDISDDADLELLLDKVNGITHIFHLSAITFVPESINNPEKCFEVNTLALIKFIDHLIKRGVKSTFIYISTSEVYGIPESLPVKESHRLMPQNPYSISKMAGDLYCQFVYKQYGFPVIVLRPFNHSGPGQNERFVLSNFAKQFVEMLMGIRENILYVGNLNVERDFLHVQDVVRAYEYIAMKGNLGEVYNVCSGKAVKLTQVVEILKNITGIEPQILVDPSKTRQVDVPSIYGSYEKLFSHTGWEPTLSIEQIIKDLVEFWKIKISQK